VSQATDTSTPQRESSTDLDSGKKPTLHSPTQVQSSSLKQVWKEHKTPENSGVAFGKMKAEGGERGGEELFALHLSSLRGHPPKERQEGPQAPSV
jgi:hypothetical protein